MLSRAVCETPGHLHRQRKYRLVQDMPHCQGICPRGNQCLTRAFPDDYGGSLPGDHVCHVCGSQPHFRPCVRTQQNCHFVYCMSSSWRALSRPELTPSKTCRRLVCASSRLRRRCKTTEALIDMPNRQHVMAPPTK